MRSWPEQHLQRAISFGHPPAQGSHAVGQYAPTRQCALRKDHKAGPQEPCGLFGRWPHASGICAASHKALHQEWTGPGEHASLADRHCRWLPGVHQPQVRSGKQWTPRVPDLHQRRRLPGPQPLYLKCWVLKADALPIKTLKSYASRGEDASMAPVKLLFHSLFRQMDLVMNDALVATSGETYLYRACLMLLLSYGCDTKETWLKCLEGWQRDADGMYDAQENLGLISRWKIIANSRLFDFKGRLHSDMLLQERLMPNNLNVCLMLSCSQLVFHLMNCGAKPESHVGGGHHGGTQGQVCALRTAVPGKDPDRLGGQIPASPCGHQAIHPGQGGQHSRRGCFVQWKNTCQGHRRPSEQWSFCQCLAEESLHLCTYGNEFGLPGCGWMATTGPALAARLGARPLCWDLPCPTEVQWHVPKQLEQWNVCRTVRGWQHAVVLGPDTWWQRWCDLPIPPDVWGMVKASLRFARPLLATTTLLAYVQYDNLVVIEAYHTVTFHYNAWCSAGNFRRPSGESPRRLGHWSASTPRMNSGPCLPSSPVPTPLPQLMVGLLGNTGWVFSSRTLGMPSTSIPTALDPRSLSTNDCRAWATGTYGTLRKCYKGRSRGPVDSTLSTSWPCAAGVCPWGPLPAHSGNTTSPTMRPRSDAIWDDIHTTTIQG